MKRKKVVGIYLSRTLRGGHGEPEALTLELCEPPRRIATPREVVALLRPLLERLKES